MRKIVPIVVSVGMILGISMTSAGAVTSGTFSAISLTHGGVLRGQISNNKIQLQKPEGSGDRARWTGTLTDKNADDKDDAYGKITWWANGNRCYVSSVTTAGTSVACGNGWSWAEEDRLVGTSDTKGVSRAANFYYDGSDGAVRVGVKVCRDRGVLIYDPCNEGNRIAGVEIR